MATASTRKVCSDCGTELKQDLLKGDWFCPECDPERAAQLELESEEQA
jgi:uncharacterized Zn finger protein (UPF0148 family)